MADWDGSIPCHPISSQKIVYVEVPKAGCTSVKAMLAPLKNRGEPPTDEDELHHWFGYKHARSFAELYRWLDSPWRHWFRFTVVRHPVTRFESFFYNFYPNDDVNEFAITRLSAERDIHAVRQTDIIGPDLSHYSFVGRLEDTAHIERALSDVVGRPVAFPHLNVGRAPRRTTLSAEALNAVRAHYRADFKILGYE